MKAARIKLKTKPAPATYERRKVGRPRLSAEDYLAIGFRLPVSLVARIDLEVERVKAELGYHITRSDVVRASLDKALPEAPHARS